MPFQEPLFEHYRLLHVDGRLARRRGDPKGGHGQPVLRKFACPGQRLGRGRGEVQPAGYCRAMAVGDDTGV
jgi:hypothetical protein